MAPRLDAEKLAKALPGVDPGVRLHAVDFCRVPSVELGMPDLVALVKRLEAGVREGIEAFVVTQGTDTLEEFAFGLDLLWARPEPLIVTGAMRAPGALGADGPANLLSAVQLAASPAARNNGCLVVLNEEIHDARHVRKAHATSLAAFESAPAGPIGALTEGRVRLWGRPSAHPRRLRLPEEPLAPLAVAIVRVALGDDGRTLKDLGSQGYAGAIVEAMGAGHVPSALVEPLRELAKRMPVVLTSRTGAGELLRGTYGFPGSETDLRAAGLIWAGSLDGLKARVKLTLLLMAGSSRTEVQAAFEADSGNADDTEASGSEKAVA